VEDKKKRRQTQQREKPKKKDKKNKNKKKKKKKTKREGNKRNDIEKIDKIYSSFWTNLHLTTNMNPVRIRPCTTESSTKDRR